MKLPNAGILALETPCASVVGHVTTTGAHGPVTSTASASMKPASGATTLWRSATPPLLATRRPRGYPGPRWSPDATTIVVVASSTAKTCAPRLSRPQTHARSPPDQSIAMRVQAAAVARPRAIVPPPWCSRTHAICCRNDRRARRTDHMAARRSQLHPAPGLTARRHRARLDTATGKTGRPHLRRPPLCLPPFGR
jgi:hypothetical protein